MELDWIYFALGFTEKNTSFEKREVACCYLMWYSFGRFLSKDYEQIALLFRVIRVSQLLSAVLFIGTIILFIWRKKEILPDYDRSLGKNN